MIAPEPFFKARGTPFSILHRLRALSRLNHSVDLVTYHLGEDVDIPNVNIHRSSRLPFIKQIDIGPSYTKIILDLFLLMKAWRLLIKNKYECIHTHEEAGVFGAMLSKIFNLPHIYDMHSSIPEQLVNYNFTKIGFLLKLANLGERWTLSKSDVVIAVCPYLKDLINKMGFTGKVVVIENIPISQYKENTPQEEINKLKEEFSLKRDSFNIVYTGNFECNQGIDLLIESIPLVIKDNMKVKFLLVGGEAHQIEYLRRKIHYLGATEKVIFSGKRPPKQIPVFMDLAEVLVSPRKIGNNVPLKVYTYLAAGKPIVATKIPAHTQVLNEEVAMLTEANPEAFAEGILAVLRDKQLRNRLGERTRRLAEEIYSYSDYLAKIKEVCDHIVKGETFSEMAMNGEK